MRKRHPTLASMLRACFLLLLLLFANTIGADAQGANTLEGRVSLPNGSPPPNSVRITLTYNGRRIQETFTDLSGRFYFPGLTSGRYQLAAEGDGVTFETTTVYADVSGFGASPQSFSQNIQLTTKAGAAIPPASVVSVEELDPKVPAPAREKYQKALKSIAENKPEQAVKLLGEAVGEYPDFYAANLALGEQQAKLQHYDAALDAYRKAGELKPDRPAPYVGIGVTLVNQQRYTEGIALLRRIVELDEKLPAPYLSLGYAEMMTGDYAAAEKHLRRACELGKPTVAHIYLANIYEKLGEPAKAIEQLRAYLKENPQSENAGAVRGAIEKLRKQVKEKE